MKQAYRINISVINTLSQEVTESEIETYWKQKSEYYKKQIQPFVIPKDGVLNGDTLKDEYFPIFQNNGKPFDIFISHSHDNNEKAILLALWIEKTHHNLKCFVDSFAWTSADQLLKEIDNKYCSKKHNRTYDYNKRNFTTSHVHAILSMSLLDIIVASKFCIFIESKESITLSNDFKKKTLSPWLYEEIRYMKLLQSFKQKKQLNENVIEKSFKCAYDISAIQAFPSLDKNMLETIGSTII